MTDFHPRLFTSDDEIAHLGEGLLTCNLSREEWTHEAHLAAATYLAVVRPDIDLESELPGLIRRFNESVGGVNNESQGYHETITRAYLRGTRLFLEEADCKAPVYQLVNKLLLSPMGQRDWPQRFWSKDLLMSVAARRDYIEPDVASLP